MCQEVGTRGENSTLPESALVTLACLVSAPHMVPVKIIAPTILISLPEELTMFHVDIESG